MFLRPEVIRDSIIKMFIFLFYMSKVKLCHFFKMRNNFLSCIVSIKISIISTNPVTNDTPCIFMFFYEFIHYFDMLW